MLHCPISLLISSCPHFVGQSDACIIYMGGLCFPLLLKWRLPQSVFRCLPEWQASSPDETDFHINIPEFIALVINALLIMMYFTNLHHQDIPILLGLYLWILLLEADNMSTLSWMSKLSCMQESHILNLCHIFSHIVFYFNTMCPSRFDVRHIVGILNIEVDALHISLRITLHTNKSFSITRRWSPFQTIVYH